MIHRRAVLAIITLFTLAVIVASTDDCFARSSLEEFLSSAREESFASCRLGGSVFATTGDPDDLSTYKRNTTGNGGVDDLIRDRSRDWLDRFSLRAGQDNLWRCAWMYLRMRVVGAF